MRRIKLYNGEFFQVRPSFMMPSMIVRTDEVEKALFLCRWGIPFWALTYVFGGYQFKPGHQAISFVKKLTEL